LYSFASCEKIKASNLQSWIVVMMHKSVFGFAILFTLHLANAQDFQKSYEIHPGGQILIGNFFGNIAVTGYSGSTVEVKAIRKGPDRQAIQISDLSLGNRVELMPIYPRFHNRSSGVDFEVKVPESIPLNFDRLSSFSGSVVVSNVTGRLRADSQRGNVEIKDVRGLVSATSVSGNVLVDFSRVPERGNMRFRSISGNVEVTAPPSLDALIEMSSESGMLRTDFPIDVQERRYGPGREARGKLGSGKLMLWINSNSGRVSLTQRAERQT
jgi:hypothetical protein